MGPNIALVDSAQSCAEQAAALLNQQNLGAADHQKGTYHYFVTDDPVKFCESGEKLFGCHLTALIKYRFLK